MNQTDMADKDRRATNRIPVRFVGGDEGAEETGEGGLTPEEIGRASIYEDAGEIERRIRRGEEEDTEEGRERADDEDLAGTIDSSELPRSRNDQDTTASHDRDDAGGGQGESGEPTRKASEGPAMAELIATRAELRRVEGELKKWADERQDLLDKFARRQAEFENFRKRTERERTETYQRALGDVVGRFLPVLDNLQHALGAAAVSEAAQTEEFSHFLHGIELISRQFDGVLQGLGVEPVATVGAPFDPHVHEAVATEETDEYQADTVTEEMRRGYRLGDKLLRPAMVKVAKP